MEKVNNISVSSTGEIILSNHARKQLGLENCTTLTEVVVGNYVILMPHNQVLEPVRRRAHEALQKSGTTITDLKAEVERLKAARFAEQYPDLA